MIELRKIRDEEKELILFLLEKLNSTTVGTVISELVDDYEGAKMGSIGLGKPEAVYAGDLIQVEYVDSDKVPVVITLTKDTDNQLLDLDFWKVDFSKLLVYPKPSQIIFKENYIPNSAI
ncbi:MAG: hypothetical protein V4683_04170 [Bacteroidota bacterium]